MFYLTRFYFKATIYSNSDPNSKLFHLSIMSILNNLTFKLWIPIYICSVDSVLYSREVDPAELLMDLGFGGQATDPLGRIPARFFQPSKVLRKSLFKIVQEWSMINW